ncbi:MAG TPA: hypothetical protein VMT22_14915 [Terriglobales bacterium]|nr:hypothetical protein [Terriglobales bacterium]
MARNTSGLPPCWGTTIPILWVLPSSGGDHLIWLILVGLRISLMSRMITP